ncbi:hypothetical protein ACJROX_05570 [Pseudalkalibacillus sp. A8]|uniref:hypothetical protein n=1 Tax=Pseudalkalibacillus sp. A8 TaxID=3382641 RepID=UPI0038B5F958
MVKDLNEQLILIKGNLRKKQKWEKQLMDYKKELTDIKLMISDLKEKLSSEQSDVEKLEGFSVTRWLLTLKGTKEEQLDKEKQEVATVQLKLEEAIQSKDEVDETIDELNKKIKSLGNVGK